MGGTVIHDRSGRELLMSAKPLLDHVYSAGFPLDRSSIIHLFVGGSALHGAKIEGYDDLDIYGCYVEPPERILGLLKMEHFCWSSGSQAETNTAEDVDVTLYSLRRWAELATKGNPTILHFLFTSWLDTEVFTWQNFVQPLIEQFLTRRAAKQHLGFANSQRMRLTGERGMGRHGQRLDLIEKFGWDVKFGMHMIRILLECRELLTDRFITFPRPEKNLLIDIRSGKWTQAETLRLHDDLRTECDSLLDNSKLPEGPNLRVVSETLAKAYRRHWD
jgi:uncharacterized protein